MGMRCAPKTLTVVCIPPAMSKQVLVSMLRQGNTASEILSILDAIVSDNVRLETAPEGLQRPMPTLTEIDF
jgi:hypothetical protein